MNIAALIKLMRPKQWVKNAFVLAPLVFSAKFLQPHAIYAALIAFVLFCLAASATYIINDIRDREQDRLHPEKCKKRPLAAGDVTIPQALVLLSLILVLLIMGCFFDYRVMLIIIAYLLMNVAYSFKLKHIPVVDIFTIAMGFVLRVLAGAVAIAVPLSGFMFVTTLCLALYLASIKRQKELQLETKANTREVLRYYNLDLIRRYSEISASSTLLFYSLYVITNSKHLVITIPFVLFGLFRYWYLAECTGQGESPTEALLGDYILLMVTSAWVIIAVYELWPK